MPFQKGHKYSRGRKNIVISSKKKPVKRLGRPPNTLRSQNAKEAPQLEAVALSGEKESLTNEDAVTIVSSASTVTSITRSSSPISSQSSLKSSDSNRSTPNVSRSTSPVLLQSLQTLQPKELDEEALRKDARNLRMCLVCNSSIHQDQLFTHLGNHYYDDTKCKFCDKVATNPCTFVTHISTHAGKNI